MKQPKQSAETLKAGKKTKGDFMENNKLKSEVEATVKRLADNYFEDMQRHPRKYESTNTRDIDCMWEDSIEYAKEDMKSEPKEHIDEDFQEEMSNKDWEHIDEIVEDITWLTYVKKEIDAAFAQAV